MNSFISHARHFSRSTLVFCLGVLCGLVPVRGHATAFQDSIELGKGASEKSHRVEISGKVPSERITTTLGAITETYPARTVGGLKSSLTFDLAAPSAGKPAVLEIQEIHNRRPGAFGYTLLVNGQEVYFRTYQELGTGPNHYCIPLTPEVMGNSNSLRITIRNEGSAPFSIGRVWLYSDFFNETAKRETVYRPMAMYINALKDADKSLPDKIKQCEEMYSGMSCYGPAGYNSGAISYAAQNFSLLKKLVDGYVDVMAVSGAGIQITMNASGWGGAISGPDGKGGSFYDMYYSQMSIDPVTGVKNPSYPNIWNNVMGTTYANPYCNRILRLKFDQFVSYLSERLGFMTADGTLPKEPINFARELGIDYMANGDFHPDWVAAARKDGIKLDPRDGLDARERQWMFNNITAVYEWMGKDFVQSMGRNPVRVDRGQVQLPSEQWVDNLYSHTNAPPLNVLRDRSWGGWQNGVTHETWSSGEFGKGEILDERLRDDYIRSRGKLAIVNRERYSLMEDFSYCKNLYQQGYLFQAFYGTTPKDPELFKAVDRIENEPAMPPEHCEPNCLDLDMIRDQSLGSPEQIAGIENLWVRRTSCGHHTDKMVVRDTAKTGSIVYRLTNRGEAFPSGLSLTVMGRIAPGDGHWIEVASGPTPEAMTVVKKMRSQDLPYPTDWRVHQTSLATIQLGDGAKGKKEYFLRLTFSSQKAFDATFLHQLRVGMTWQKKTGLLAGSPFTCQQSRIANLWIQDRAVAERLLKAYSELGGEDAVWKKAKAIYDEGYYRSAYAALVGEYSQLLPARYAIRGSGPLGRYPLAVQLPDQNATALIDLKKVTKAGAEFAVKVHAPETMQVAFSAAKNGSAYRLTTLGENQFSIAEASDAKEGAIKAANGSVSFTVQVAPMQEKSALPKELTGKYISGNRQNIRVELGDLKMTQYQGYVDIPLASNVVFSRNADRLSAPPDQAPNNNPQPNDKVEVVLDPQGKAVQVRAVYGIDKGRIKSFEPPSFSKKTNGIIELEGGRRYELNVGTMADTLHMHRPVSQYEVASLASAFQPGDEFELTYCPYTFNGKLPRILKISQPYSILLDANYTKMSGDDWKKELVTVNQAVVEPHALDPSYIPNYIKTVLYPSAPFEPGYVVYKLQRSKPFERVAVEYMGRIFEDSSRVEFFVSSDNQTWSKCWQFDNSRLSYMPLGEFPDNGPWTFFDVSNKVKGLNAFYLKIQLTRHADDQRFGMTRVRVVANPE